ncbi:2-oxoacid:ferredoxin oxidoreductase, gamma subunit [Thermanaerovibrio velox DSM 12556]|uniref:2-oxoacid:ferredoxin oxidoreductase, gamma subunit n=1 Tax=Thermanaerovibrio velox DSM 12556 TaxID=926567 RepID=H0UP30_9BACT|nr:indolepyruvate oxidoreductase subunit beta [Thermanaerovibrio velox]EHM10533.1 2-oxoacid:ferredoxin oxidoreductase, gamma subunit [Thermanaerovibrio velox DSM 12556]
MNSNSTKSILLVGVGGQGTILASKVLSEGLMRMGYDVKMSEIHGMSQRGGSVTTHVRYGSKVYSPVISEGEADILVAFEKLEAARWLTYLKDRGVLVVNDYEIYPVPVLLGRAKYPEDLNGMFRRKVKDVKIFDAGKVAQDLGNVKAQNVVLLGALIKAMGLDAINWEEVLAEVVPARFLELNVKALKAGMEL